MESPSHSDLDPSSKQITMPLSITSFVSTSRMFRITAFLNSGNALCSLVIRFTASNALLPDMRITETPHFTIWPAITTTLQPYLSRVRRLCQYPCVIQSS